ncbi:MAG: hypothetical protein SFU86_16630 [Pirellulaceae bacterium]|nr:hypothetical protein [Pirellulaceae bacterium]
MSRMLQALKKLEARSAWTAVPSAPVLRLDDAITAVGEADSSAPAVGTPSAVEAIAPPPAIGIAQETVAPFPAVAPAIVVQPLPAFLAALSEHSGYGAVVVEAPRLEIPQPRPAAPPASKSATASTATPPVPAPEPVVAATVQSAGPASPTAAPASKQLAPTRQFSSLERTVARALADATQAEPYRQTAQRLAEAAQEIAGHSLLLVGVGAASETHDVTLHTAAALAEQHGPVLVVDADLARRGLTDQLNLADVRGLAELLRGDCPAADAIQATMLTGVSILTPGRAGLMLTSSTAERLPAVFDKLAADFRLILIDGGRTGEPGVLELARVCDATYFVVRLGSTEAAQAQAALREFRSSAARVLGCIATS